MKIRLARLSCCVLLTMLAGCMAPVQAPATSATEATPAAATSSECEEGFRLFDHELLQSEPVCIPATPQRILALDMAGLEMLLLAGHTPVGTANWILEEYSVLLPQFADALANVEGLGYPAELEQVALLNPDLILAPDDTIDVAQASQIAPVIVP